MNLLHTFNEENVSEEEVATYTIRTAVRAIVFDESNNIGIIHIPKTNHPYYELPGGKVEEGETLEEACIRECKEEIGCTVEIVYELGITREYRKRLERVNESHCFVAKVVGEKGVPELTEKEKALGVEPVWLPYDEALRVIRENFETLKDSIELYDRYVLQRSIILLDHLK